MGDKPLKVDSPSLAAASYFSKIKEERGLSERGIIKGTGMVAKGRANRLITGKAPWMLDDVERFAIYLGIPTGVAFAEIIKEMQRLTSESDCPCNQESLAG